MADARIDLRCTATQKQQIERYASSMGLTRTEFMLYAAERLIAERKQQAQTRKDAQ